MKTQYFPQIKIANMITKRFNDLFVIKDMDLLAETDELWHIHLTIAGPFEQMTKKIIVKKDAFIIWTTLEEGVIWDGK